MLVSILIIASYNSAIKASLTKQTQPTFITQLHEIVGSGIPIYHSFLSEESFEALKESPYYFDKWLYENAVDNLSPTL